MKKKNRWTSALMGMMIKTMMMTHGRILLVIIVVMLNR